MTTETFRIPAENYGELVQRLAKIQRKAKKLDAKPISFRILETLDEEVEDGGIRRICVTEISGETPRIAGWAFIGTLQHAGEAGTILRAVPGESIPTEYRTKEAWCDHCRKIRVRTDTYVLRNEQGECCQVGSTCLGDFLGFHDPHRAAAICQWLSEAKEAAEEYEGRGGGKSLARLDAYLAYVAAMIRQYGWVSRGKARDEGRSATADLAATAMFRPYPKPEDKPTSEDVAVAEAALAWAEEHLLAVDPESLNDYLYNLRVVCSLTGVDPKSFGLAASLIPTYKREIEKENIAQERAKRNASLAETSQYVGKVGERTTLRGLRLLGVTEIEGRFGVTCLHRFVDADGNYFVWFASGRSLADGVFDLKATVKEHREYSGIRQTVLTRCAVEAVELVGR